MTLDLRKRAPHQLQIKGDSCRYDPNIEPLFLPEVTVLLGEYTWYERYESCFFCFFWEEI